MERSEILKERDAVIANGLSTKSKVAAARAQAANRVFRAYEDGLSDLGANEVGMGPGEGPLDKEAEVSVGSKER